MHTSWQEEPIARWREFAAAFPGAHAQAIFASLFEQFTAGRLWVRPHDTEPVAWLWDQGNSVFYVTGDLSSSANRQHCAALVSDVVRPAALQAGAPWFSIHCHPTLAREELVETAPAAEHWPVQRRFYQWPVAAAAPAVTVPAGVVLQPIDEQLLARTDLANLEEVIGEIRWMWPSTAQFMRDGLGTVAVVEQVIACWCTGEYRSDRQVGLGITTAEPYRRRGIATATAAHAVTQALAQGLRPFWECAEQNLASQRLAETVGCVCTERSSVWVGRFGE
jgi:RimJ/RimL family protein N-acetyltransferase